MKEHDEPIRVWLRALVAAVGPDLAHRAVDIALAKFSVVERAAFATHWRTWARSKQLAPVGEWLSWGNFTSRGWGKTKGIAHHIVEEVQAKRAMRIGVAAEKEEKSVEAQIGALINASPPWFRPTWEATKLHLVWPNGARALVFTPEAPGAIRSENFHLSWLSELQSWPTATREEAYSNFVFATRVGYARMIWDSTPKRGHEILKRLIARAKDEPDLHIIVRGIIYENPWLTKSAVASMEREYAGTTKGREELFGEQLDDADNPTAKQTWIDMHRRPMPDRFVRRGIGVDAAVTTRKGSDRTGIVEAGLGVDGQGYVLGDRSGKHRPEAWADIVLTDYVSHGCSIVVVETNKGGDLLVRNLRAAAKDRRLSVVVVNKDERPHPQSGVVFVKEIHSRGEKSMRAQPLSTAYEAGRVSHVRGVDLTTLEETLSTWEPSPGARSPDDLDALNSIMTEMLDLRGNVIDPKEAFQGIVEAGRQLAAPAAPNDLSRLLGDDGTGGRI